MPLTEREAPVGGQTAAGTPPALRPGSPVARPDVRAESDFSCGGQRRARVLGAEADKGLTTKLGEGWYAEETSPTGPFHWMSAAGHIDVTAKTGGTLVIRCHLRSIVPDNSVELFVDDKPIQSVKLNGVQWQECVLRMAVSAGVHHLALRSHQPGNQPPGDNRVLTICVENLLVELES